MVALLLATSLSTLFQEMNIIWLMCFTLPESGESKHRMTGKDFFTGMVTRGWLTSVVAGACMYIVLLLAAMMSEQDGVILGVCGLPVIGTFFLTLLSLANALVMSGVRWMLESAGHQPRKILYALNPIVIGMLLLIVLVVMPGSSSPDFAITAVIWAIMTIGFTTYLWCYFNDVDFLAMDDTPVKKLSSQQNTHATRNPNTSSFLQLLNADSAIEHMLQWGVVCGQIAAMIWVILVYAVISLPDASPLPAGSVTLSDVLSVLVLLVVMVVFLVLPALVAGGGIGFVVGLLNGVPMYYIKRSRHLTRRRKQHLSYAVNVMIVALPVIMLKPTTSDMTALQVFVVMVLPLCLVALASLYATWQHFRHIDTRKRKPKPHQA